ncbi:MAG: hypothetical protein JW722_00340 [Demequinaceae bacterium]|nr:hypothetical protein [Demequinaceae bacterium]
MTEAEVSLEDLISRYTISIDHQLALKAALHRLTRKFSAMFTDDTIERFLTGSYEQYSAHARFPHYVHLLAERFAYERLTAFAIAEHHLTSGRPIVVFVCQGNDILSPMARGLFMMHVGGDALGWSAGIDPALTLHTGVRPVLREVGVDVNREFPKPLAREMLQAATTVVAFGCIEAIPRLPGREYIDAEAPEPVDGDLDSLREIRDWLLEDTAALLQRLEGEPT